MSISKGSHYDQEIYLNRCLIPDHNRTFDTRSYKIRFFVRLFDGGHNGGANGWNYRLNI